MQRRSKDLLHQIPQLPAKYYIVIYNAEFNSFYTLPSIDTQHSDLIGRLWMYLDVFIQPIGSSLVVFNLRETESKCPWYSDGETQISMYEFVNHCLFSNTTSAMNGMIVNNNNDVNGVVNTQSIEMASQIHQIRMVYVPAVFENGFLTLTLDDHQILMLNGEYTFIYDLSTSKWWTIQPSVFDCTIESLYLHFGMWFVDMEAKQTIRILCQQHQLNDDVGMLNYECREIKVQDLLDRKQSVRIMDTTRSSSSSLVNPLDVNNTSKVVHKFPYTTYYVKSPMLSSIDSTTSTIS